MKGFLFVLVQAACAYNIGFIGMAGVGKTTLVQQLCDNSDTVSHQGDGTLHVVPYTQCIHNWTVYDFPGYGTNTVPDLQRFFAQAFTEIHLDLVVMCVGTRVYQQDAQAYAMMDVSRLTPLVVARTRCDVFPCDMFQLWLMSAESFPRGIVFPVSVGDELANARIEMMTRFMDYMLKNPRQ